MMGWNPNRYDWMWSGYQANSMTFVGMMVMIVLLAIAVGFGAWLLVRGTRQGGITQVNSESPRAILDRRFASGEIDAEEYAQARRVLQTPGATQTR